MIINDNNELRDDKNNLAVIISKNHGEGFSTYHDDKIATDGRIALKILNNPDFFINNDKDIIKDFFNVLGYDINYYDGLKDLVIEWVPPNTLYRIEEYKGYESIILFDESAWFNSN